MITTNMRLYNYFTIGDIDEYGQQKMPDYDNPVGQIKMSVYTTSQSTQANINYKDANYIGLTLADVNDTYIIEHNNDKLKVLYVNPCGRYNQVFMRLI